MEQQTKFEGWAVIELFGHAREAGYVTTEYFGSGALFRVEVPALDEREVTLIHPEWVNETMLYPGSKVMREAVQGRTRFIGPSAIYAMNPCDELAAKKALESMTPRKVRIIEIAKNERQLPGEPQYADPFNDEDEYEDEESGMRPVSTIAAEDSELPTNSPVEG